MDRSARTLARAGWDVVLIAIKNAETPAFEDRGDYVVRRVELLSRKLPRWTRPLRFVEAILRTFAAAYREDADVYDPRDAYPLMVAHWAAGLRRAKVVYDSDELNLDRNWAPSRNPVWRFFMKRYESHYARKSAAVITSDHGRADVLAERYGVEPVVLLNVPEKLEAPDPDREFRSRAIGDKRYLLIYQGVLVPNRGLPEMIEAMRHLPDCRLAIVGFGHIEDQLKAQVREGSLEDSVVFFDAVPIEVLMRYTAAADVGVIPLVGSCLSYVLAAPNKLFEYMMAGIPVVATDLPDMAKVVREEHSGTLISDPTDPHSIAHAVRELLDGWESLEDIGARARAAALARYNWEAETFKLLEVYDRLWPEGQLRPADEAAHG